MSQVAKYDASLADEIKAMSTAAHPISPQQIKDFLIATRRFEEEFLGPKLMTYTGSIAAVKLVLKRAEDLDMLTGFVGSDTRFYGEMRTWRYEWQYSDNLRHLLALLLRVSKKYEVPFERLPPKFKVTPFFFVVVVCTERRRTRKMGFV